LLRCLNVINFPVEGPLLLTAPALPPASIVVIGLTRYTRKKDQFDRFVYLYVYRAVDPAAHGGRQTGA